MDKTLMEFTMARADLLTALVKFGMAGDKARFRKVVESIIAEERAKKHTVLSEKLEDLLLSNPVAKPISNGTATLDHRINNFVHEVIPERKLDDLIFMGMRDVLQIISFSLGPKNQSDILCQSL